MTIAMISENKEVSARKRLTPKFSRWPYSRAVRSEVTNIALSVLESSKDRADLSEVEMIILRDYADCCERIEQGKEVAELLRIDDPSKWGALISKLQCETQLKQRLLKSLRVIGTPSEYEKKLAKPEGGGEWKGIL